MKIRTTTELGSSSVLMLKTVPSAGQAISSSVNAVLRTGSLKKYAQKTATTAHNTAKNRQVNNAQTHATNASTAKNFSPIGCTVNTQPKHLEKVLLMSSSISYSCGINKKSGQGGTWTPTALRPTDFKSVASAISPPALYIHILTKNLDNVHIILQYRGKFYLSKVFKER